MPKRSGASSASSPAAKRASGVSAAADDEVRIVEIICAVCKAPDATQLGCGHGLHKQCVPDACKCARCKKPLKWQELAALLEREAYLAFGAKSPAPAKLEQAVGAWMAAETKHRAFSSVPRTPSAAPAGRKAKRGKRAKALSSASAWASGTGFGGAVSHAIETSQAMLETAFLRQKAMDAAVLPLVRAVTSAVQMEEDQGPHLEALFRKDGGALYAHARLKRPPRRLTPFPARR
jgi:hypothetical protein